MSEPVFHEQWYEPNKKALLVSLARSVTADGAWIEVGTWEGRSALALAAVLPDERKLCVVDHWQGDTDNPAAVAGREGISPATLAGRDVYARFVANVAAAGVEDRICIHRRNWREFARYYGRSIALLHLDSAHDYETVRDQLATFTPWLVSGALLVGDDWTHSGTRRAVVEAIPGVNYQGNLWWKRW